MRALKAVVAPALLVLGLAGCYGKSGAPPGASYSAGGPSAQNSPQDTPHEARSAATPSARAFSNGFSGHAPLGYKRKAVSDAVFSRPHDVALSPDGAYLLVSDIGNDLIQVLDPETLEIVARFGGDELDSPHDVAFQTDRRVLVADTLNHRIAVYDFRGVTEGQAQAKLIESWTDGISKPEGVAAAPNGGPVYVTNVGDHSVTKLDFNGKRLAKAGQRGGAPLEFVRPHDISVAADGRVIVVDSGNHRLQVLDPDLKFLRELAGAPYHFNEPKYVAFSRSGKLFVADEYNSQIKILDTDFAPVDFIGSGVRGSGPGDLNWPEGVDVRGQQMWIADTYNDRILRYERPAP